LLKATADYNIKYKYDIKRKLSGKNPTTRKTIMLQLIDIKKDYQVGGESVHALKGITLNFRRNEFVSILGASGCGKTTLLNIIGGLDKYTSGDLLIEGRSTKEYKDGDWDTYRNHSIGFIFQSYHLIPHQTVLQNVELALTISGISREERRERAIEALDRVGLKDKINSRPNQLSGGQAQRVAIARALINDPEVVLADEPTGALDSKTSVQIMELLKEISRDRLVIMVTHNPELAEKYSTRIIRLLDGLVIGDTMPFDGVETKSEQTPSANETGESKRSKGKVKSSMSIFTAFLLSLKNLLSKRGRTIMVSVAGSIGIIGVSMVLAISAGVQNYIVSMEDDMLSGYPLTITETAIDYDSVADMSSTKKVDIKKLSNKIYIDSLLDTLMSMGSVMVTNKIDSNYISYVKAMPSDYYNAIQYSYNFEMANNIYTDFTVADDIPASADTSGNYSITAIRNAYTWVLLRNDDYQNYASLISTTTSFKEIPNNYEYILSQYDILASYNGKTTNLSTAELKDIFENKDSLIMVLNDNSISDINFGQFAYFTQDEFLNFAYKALLDNNLDDKGFYDESVIKEFLEGKDINDYVGENSKVFTWYPNDTIYTKASSTDMFYQVSLDSSDNIIPSLVQNVEYKYNASSENFSKEGAVDMQVKVILQKKEGVSYGSLSSGLYYTNALTQHMLETSMNSQIVKYINENGDLSCIPYNFAYSYVGDDGNYIKSDSYDSFHLFKNTAFISSSSNSSNIWATMFGGTSESSNRISVSDLGGSDLPISVKIYPLDFDSKDLITDYLDVWNDMCEGGQTYNGVTLTTADEVKYTDTVGLIIAMVNTMIQVITIALVAFTALSLVVSTVMVGIITYVSVVERIKEIGILRAMGARKKDIKRLFNAETFIIGLCAGVVGIVITYIISLIINIIVGLNFGVYGIAALPVWEAIVMICVSIILTLISGLIPASAAAKKDPVVALRTE
jgi:putative ABC transport system permease protein